MSNILDDFLADQAAPSNLKEKVMASARMLILAKDLGELFSLGLKETGTDVVDNIDVRTNSNLSKPKNKKHE